MKKIYLSCLFVFSIIITKAQTPPNAACETVLNFKLLNLQLPTSLSSGISGDTAITIEYWFKGSSHQSAMCFNDFATTGNYIIAGYSNGQHVISNDGGSAGGVAIDPIVNDGNWHHIAMTWQKNTINGFKSYVDGVVYQQRNSANVNLPAISSQCFIGAEPNNTEFMSGSMDEIRVWSTALSQTEIQLGMNVQLTGTEAGLKAYWNCNEGAGNVVNDKTVNGYDGALGLNVGEQNWRQADGLHTTCGGRAAINFSVSPFIGSGPFISAPVVLPPTNTTCEFWFRTSGNGGLFSVVDNDAVSALDRSIYINNGNISAFLYAGATETITTSGTNYADGNWHHLAYVIGASAGGQKLYLDGILAASGSFSASSFITNTKIHLGFSTLISPTSFTGDMDEVRIWSIAKTPTEIQNDMTCSLKGPKSGLMANYSFDEYGIANGNNGGFFNIILDESGNNYTATPYYFGFNGTSSNWVTDANVSALPPTVIANASSSNICSGSSLTLTGGGTATSFVWDHGVTNGVPFNPTTSETYIVTGTLGTCSNTASIAVNIVSGLPTVNLGPDQSVCDGDYITIDAGLAPVSYLWSNGSTNQTISVNTAGTYTVTCTNGCGSVSDSFILTVNPLPTQSLGSAINVCGSNTILNAQNNGATYLWSDGSTNQTLNVSASGTYYCEITTALGCFGTDSVNVGLHSPIVVDLGPDTTVCSSLVLNVPSGIGYSNNWSTGASNPSVTVTSTGNYLVDVTNACGTFSDAIGLTIKYPINFDLGIAVMQCGGSVLLDAGNIDGTYGWSTGATSQSINVSSSGTYTCTATNVCGSFSDTKDVRINPLPDVNAGTDFSYCLSGSVQLNASVSPVGTYDPGVVESGDYFNPTTIPDNSTTGITSTLFINSALNASQIQDVTVSIAHNSINQLRITLSAPNGSTVILFDGVSASNGANFSGTTFSDNGTIPISIANPPFSSSGGTVLYLPWQAFSNLTGPALGNWTLTVKDLSFSEIGTFSSWSLSFPPSVPNVIKTMNWTNPGGLSSTTTVNPTASPSSTTTYTLTVTDLWGCTNTDQTTVYVNSNPPVVDLGPATISNCGDLNLDAGNPGSVFTWSTSATSQTITASASGTYSVSVNNGCGTSSDAINVTINNNPSLNLGADIDACGSSVSLDAGNVGSTYLWSTGETSQTITNTVGGDISVIVTDINGCVAKDTIFISEVPNPVITQNSNVLTCSVVGMSYQWYFNGSAINGATNQTFVTLIPGDYSVEVFTSLTCSATSSNFTVGFVGINENKQNTDNVCTVYPNPNNGSFTVRASIEGTYVITNELGQLIKTFEITSLNNNEVKIENLSTGIYFVLSKNNSARSKIVVTE